MPITAFYAALLALFVLLPLTSRVIARRREEKVEIGDGSDRELLRRIRVHANFIEYTPLFLLLLALAESLMAPGLLLHALGATFAIGRVIHAYGLSQTPHIMNLRVGGMVMSLIAIGAVSVLCLLYAVPRLLT